MNKLFTARGDDGFTGLMKEGRFPKNDPILEAIGALDEANAAIGLARSLSKLEFTRTLLLDVQRDMYHLMAEVSAAPDNSEKFRMINQERVHWLELQIDYVNSEISIPGEFIVPGDTSASAALDLARTVVRRSERWVVGLDHAGILENGELLRYLNRLSSLCFALELLEIQKITSNDPTMVR